MTPGEGWPEENTGLSATFTQGKLKFNDIMPFACLYVNSKQTYLVSGCSIVLSNLTNENTN